MKTNTEFRAVAPKTRIGHIHLKVSDLERALAFYRDVLGFHGNSLLKPCTRTAIRKTRFRRNAPIMCYARFCSQERTWSSLQAGLVASSR